MASLTLVPGMKVLHKYNRDLGPGEVMQLKGGRVYVHFPRTDSLLEFAEKGHAFVELTLPEGTDPENWHEAYHEDLVERLARLETDKLKAFRNRIDSLRLARIREADGLGSFLGGRIEIFPHQLHVAERAVETDPVRWLFADEVGLGKTVEACLVLSRLVRMKRAERVIIVAPASLTVQWLGELYRKFHQVFVLLDAERRKDVRKDFGDAMNPFHVHERVVVSLEDLATDSQLASWAKESEADLLVVDEAHRLERRPGHPGSPAYRAIEPLTQAIRHVLLLSATPLEADAHGFFRLLQMLRPKEYPDWERFQGDLDAGKKLFPCTSSTTRTDIGGLPPRVGERVEIDTWPALTEALQEALRTPVGDALEKKRRREAVLRAMEDPTGEDDPRIAWIADRVKEWRKKGEKMLVFVNRKESLDYLKKELARRTMGEVAVFHEDLSPASRDLEVAQFALADGPPVLVSTEAGGEGRNFQFCKGLVLFDLPWSPALVEQRIGRLDRINRRRDVEIIYFAPPDPFARQIVEVYEHLGIFREPLGGLDRSLSHVEQAIQEAVLADAPHLDVPKLVEETRQAREAVNRGLYHTLHRNRYRPELADEIFDRIPEDLEERNAQVVLGACRQFGFEVVEKQGTDTWYIEFGGEALIESLPGAIGGSRWLGTFDREEAVRHETLDFFASGHELVEGVLHELEDGHRGEVTLMDIPGAGGHGAGIVAFIKEGAEFRPLVWDFEGKRQKSWDVFFTVDPPGWKPGHVADWGLGEDRETRQEWARRVRAILFPAQAEGKLVAAAAFRLLP